MLYTIESSEKTKFTDETRASGGLTICAKQDDIDTVYDALSEGLKLKYEHDLIDFQNVKDDDVNTMLTDMQTKGFISDWEQVKD